MDRCPLGPTRSPTPNVLPLDLLLRKMVLEVRSQARGVRRGGEALRYQEKYETESRTFCRKLICLLTHI